ncbi:MAG: ABC transporter substrate-binding protein [Candidatus Chromulinivorax sp.]
MDRKKINGIVIFACVAGVFYYFIHHLFENDYQQVVSDGINIAVFQPATHPALDEIVQGFIDTLQQISSEKINFTRYNANGNKILMQAQAQDMLQKKYDLIFTIGVGCSVTLHDLCRKQKNNIPQVFTAIDDPITLDLVGDHITGVQDSTNYQEQLDKLFSIKPKIKKVLLVYDQSQASGLEKDMLEIAQILTQKGAQLVPVEILQVAEIGQKAAQFMQSVDVVMVLKDNTVVCGIDSLINLCQRYHIPLLASDLNSGAKGAALAYGIYEKESGVQAAYQAYKIIDEHKVPLDVPVIPVQGMIMKINIKHALLQGLDCDLQLLQDAGIQYDQKG